MGTKKDMQTIRSILFGEELEQIQKRFSSLESHLAILQERLEEAQEEIVALAQENETLKERLKRQNDRIDAYTEEFDHSLDQTRKNLHDTLKRQNAELRMSFQKRLGILDQQKISSDALAKILVDLSQNISKQATLNYEQQHKS